MVRAHWWVPFRFADRDALDVDYVDYHRLVGADPLRSFKPAAGVSQKVLCETLGGIDATQSCIVCAHAIDWSRVD